MSDGTLDKGNGSLEVSRGRAVGAKGKSAPLHECVSEAVENFFAHLDGHPCRGLYRMVMNEVEAPLLKAVLEQTGGNQSAAAELLGINRGTLRQKLRKHELA